MKKIITLLLICLFSHYSLADSAFGTYSTMTKEDLEKKGIKLIPKDKNVFISQQAPITNKYFKVYRYSFNTSDKKICTTSGFTDFITSDKYGTQIKEKINNIKNALEQKYGEPIFINDGAMTDNDDWISALKREPKASLHTYAWNQNTDLKNHKELAIIILYPDIIANKVTIRLDYFFTEDGLCELDNDEYSKGL